MMNNPLSKYAFLIFKLLHYGFLIVILKENLADNTIVFACIAAIGLLFYSYPKLKEDDTLKHTIKDAILAILFVVLGGYSTYILNLFTDFGIILSATSVGFLGAIIPSRGTLQEASTGIYCGVFVGMTATYIALGVPFILGSSFIA